MTGWGFTWHHIDTLAQRQAPGLQNSSLNTNPSFSPCNLCICSYPPSNFHQKWKRHLVATASPKHHEDREERSIKEYYAPMELKPAVYSSCVESSGPGHAGHVFLPEEIMWNHIRIEVGWFGARKLFNPYLGNREKWKLWWGSGVQQDMDNKLQGILAGREPDQRDEDGPWRRFLHLQMEGQGSSWRSL